MDHEKRAFTPEFKREAVRFVETSGKSLAQVARDLGISDSTLQGWKQQFKEHGQQAFPGYSGPRKLNTEKGSTKID